MARFSWSMPGKLARALRRRVERAQKEEELAGRLVTILDPSSAASEAYRTLRINLLYTFVDISPKVIVLTDPGQGEGMSTTTCANLGVVLAQASKSTLILDCDFRKPAVHEIFGLRNPRGLMNVLTGELSLQEVWQKPAEGLKVVTVGPQPLSPTGILGSKYFSEFLASTREQFDYVLLDTPPLGLVSDAMILATQGDGVVLVLNAQSTRKGAVRRAVRSLKAADVDIFGTVLNNVQASKNSYSYYGYARE